MKKAYRIRGSRLIVTYLNGELLEILTCQDRIGWDAMRHAIPYDEADIDVNLFQLIGNGTNK